jgi:hypothetical protein
MSKITRARAGSVALAFSLAMLLAKAGSAHVSPA